MIDVKELRKSFASIHVLNGVDVHVKRGGIYDYKKDILLQLQL